MERNTARQQSDFPRRGKVSTARASAPKGKVTTFLVRNTSHLHDRLRQYIERIGVSQGNIAQVLGLPVRRLNYYLTDKSEVNLWPLLPALLQADPRISREWLYFGEGEMWGSAGQGYAIPSAAVGSPGSLDFSGSDKLSAERFFLTASPHNSALPLSLVGKPMQLTWLVGCDKQGWFGKSYLSVNVSQPHCGAGWIAVLASGDSLAPCGIRDGYTLFCDPEQNPAVGEAVYAQRRDGSATIKIYQGRDSNDQVVLQAWLPANGGAQKSYQESCVPEDLACLAPVIYLKCRL